MNYTLLKTEIMSLIENENNVIANMANISAILNLRFENINWVGFYLVDDDTSGLVLGPFQGKPACIRIGFNRGVCGSCLASKKSIRVDNVHEFKGHIACDSNSRSELVIPLFKKEKVFAVLDIDSPMYNRFTQEDELALSDMMNSINW